MCLKKRKLGFNAQNPKEFAFNFVVFLHMIGFRNDHIRTVLAVVCGDDSSKKPSTVSLPMSGTFF